MIKTQYICDRCQHSQNVGEQMWEMSVSFTHYNSTHFGDNRVESLWCRKCVEKIGLLSGPDETGNMEVSWSESGVIEEIANTLVTWKLIRTAPKDGTHILGFAYPIAEIPSVCRWEKCPKEIMRAGIEQWQWQTKEPGDFESDEAWLEHWSGNRYDPTYWMHLPKPPREDK